VSSTNKKSPATRGIPQPFDLRPSPLAQQIRPKTATRTVQPKVANNGVNRKPPVAPPVYRPQPVPKVLQTKKSPTQNLQASKVSVISQQRESPTAPPIYRPAQPRIAQPMMAALKRPGQQEIRALTMLRSSSVVQRMEEQNVGSSDDESPNVEIRGGTYPTIKGDDPWNDEQAMINHCITYCGVDKLVWVKFAYVVGAPPPELGHGSQLVKPKKGNKGKGGGGNKKQGSAKDAKRWKSFQDCMEGIIDSNYDHIKGQTYFKKAEKIVNAYNGNKPGWW
jgi:hypothetical protein